MINEIYDVVQNILNKNGHGILSPARFIGFSESTQIKLFNNAIGDYKREKQRKQTYASDESLRILEDVLDKITTSATLTRLSGATVNDYHIMPTDYMAWGSASYDNIPIIEAKSKDRAAIERSLFISPSESEPVCYLEGTKLYVLPSTIGIIMDGNTKRIVNEVSLSYYRYPKKPNWTYITTGGKSIFNISDPNYQDFELPYFMFNKIVIDILMQAGMHIRDESVYQYTAQEDQKEFQKDNSA